MYVDGKGVQVNYIKAFEYFSKAKDNGSITAINNMGWMYKNGFGVNTDYNKAFELFNEALQKGNHRASNKNLGDLYYNLLSAKTPNNEQTKILKNAEKLDKKLQKTSDITIVM